MLQVQHSSHPQRLSRVRISLLGLFRVSGPQGTLEIADWRLRKAASIVKMLALSPAHQVHRDVLLERLWPELDLTSALNNFYQALHVARRTVRRITAQQADANNLPLTQQVISLYFPEGFDVDVDSFEQAVDHAVTSGDPDDIGRAIDLYGGELLPEDRYEDWTLDRRRNLHERFVNLLLALGQFYESRGETESAINLFRRAVESDSTIESAHRSLMSLYARSGRRRLALRQYETLSLALRNELDVEPGLVTRMLAVQIERDDRAQRPWAPTMGDVSAESNTVRVTSDVPTAAGEAYERGVRAIGQFTWTEAIDDLSFALDAVQSSQGRDAEFECRVLLALGDAQWHGGVGRGIEMGAGHVPEARKSYMHAAEIATGIQRPDLLAHAALGVAGYCPKTTQGDLAGLYQLQRALDGVSGNDNRWHARLLGRLALYHRVLSTVEGRRQTGGSDEEIKDLAERSVDMSVRLRDDRLQGNLLLWRNLSQYGVDQLGERLVIANQVVDIAHRDSDYELLAWALHERHEYEMALGRTPAAMTSLVQFDWIADYLRMPYFVWLAHVQRGGLALGRAEVAGADRLQIQADQTWPRTGCANWLLFAIRREQLRLPEISERLNFIAGRLITSPFQDAHHLLLLAETGRHADARLMLQLQPVEEYMSVSRIFDWLPMMLNVTDACLALGFRDPMAHLFEVLAPYSELDGYSPHIRYPTGAVAGYLGHLATRLGRLDDAERLLRRSLELNREREFLLHVLWNEIHLAELRLRTEDGGDGVITRLQQIRNQAEDLQLARLEQEASRLLNEA